MVKTIQKARITSKAKVIASQIFGIPAGVVTQMAGAELFGSMPFYIPVAAWLLTSLFVIAKL
jgi:hypothetical protein